MPTSLRIGPYRFFFYAGDGTEPAHTHVQRDQANNHGFGSSELRKLERLTEQNEGILQERWNDYFNNH